MIGSIEIFFGGLWRKRALGVDGQVNYGLFRPPLISQY